MVSRVGLLVAVVIVVVLVVAVAAAATAAAAVVTRLGSVVAGSVMTSGRRQLAPAEVGELIQAEMGAACAEVAVRVIVIVVVAVKIVIVRHKAIWSAQKAAGQAHCGGGHWER